MRSIFKFIKITIKIAIRMLMRIQILKKNLNFLTQSELDENGLEEYNP